MNNRKVFHHLISGKTINQEQAKELGVNNLVQVINVLRMMDYNIQTLKDNGRKVKYKLVL